MILAGDIGGTNTRLALMERDGKHWKIIRRSQSLNKDRRGLAEIVERFLAEANDGTRSKTKIASACFGVAGPVREGRVKLTNLKWAIDEKSLAKVLRIRHVRIVNDLVAHAQGIESLGKKELITLRRGASIRSGNRAILAPGTGLGEGGLIRNPRREAFRAFHSEGGHADFSPTDERETALREFNRKRIGRCSWEDVLSGPGLKNIFQFLIARGQFQIKPTIDVATAMPNDITTAANNRSCPASIASVELVAKFYGAEGGNLALKLLATDGVYFGGGIAPHIIDYLRAPQMLAAFSSKGPPSIQKMLAEIPIHIIATPDSALFGAANIAALL